MSVVTKAIKASTTQRPSSEAAAEGQIQLQRDAWGRLELVDARGARHVPIEPVRNFPLTDPDRWVSLCTADGRELAVIDLAATDPTTRKLLDEELSRREFVPAIQRIVSMPVDSEPTEWQVETDRGPTSFLVNSADDVRRLGPHRALVVDARGIRYTIDDVRQLDGLSRRVLERYL
jgi:hypothetical protein